MLVDFIVFYPVRGHHMSLALCFAEPNIFNFLFFNQNFKKSFNNTIFKEMKPRKAEDTSGVETGCLSGFFEKGFIMNRL